MYTRFFFLRQVYLSRSQGGREIIKFFEYFSSRALCKIFQIFQIFSLLPFTSNLSRIEMYRNLYIYMYVFTVDQAILRERLGRGEGLFATTCKLRGFERLGWKASRVHCSASTLLFFNVRFLFHSLLSPIQTKFPATLLYLPFHLVYLIIHVACMYIYIFNKFTQRSFNLISQPAAYRSEQFLQIKGKNPFSSLSLFSPPRRGKINRKMLR